MSELKLRPPKRHRATKGNEPFLQVTARLKSCPDEASMPSHGTQSRNRSRNPAARLPFDYAQGKKSCRDEAPMLRHRPQSRNRSRNPAARLPFDYAQGKKPRPTNHPAISHRVESPTLKYSETSELKPVCRPAGSDPKKALRYGRSECKVRQRQNLGHAAIHHHTRRTCSK